MMANVSTRTVLFARRSNYNKPFSNSSIRAFADVPEPVHAEWKTFGDLAHYRHGKFYIKTFNKISHHGLSKFSKEKYEFLSETEDRAGTNTAHAILLRSYKIKEEEIQQSVLAIARCGAGTNNIPVSRMTELGIPVFNTPGANANAVKELILCGLLLGSRRVIDGINHMKEMGKQGMARERVEKDKALFGGREIMGKTLAVIGLGHIGGATAREASDLGMKIKGYDPGLSVRHALELPDGIILSDSIASAVSDADYISINIPYVKGEGGTHGIIGQDVIRHFKNDAVLLNFARGELVDSESMKHFLDNSNGRYVSDFPDDLLWNHKNSLILPHLGASTEEAEDAAALMAAETVCEYLEAGTIRNSVNFPSAALPVAPDGAVRFTVVNKNIPGCLASIDDVFAAENLNIVQQLNTSRDSIAYNVIDIDSSGHDNVLSFIKTQKRLSLLNGVLNSRVIYPGTRSDIV